MGLGHLVAILPVPAICLGGALAFAQSHSPVLKPLTCVTTKCHEELKTGVSVHGPVKANGCTVCHAAGKSVVALPAGHKSYAHLASQSAAQVNETCVLCHDSLRPLLDSSSGGHKAISRDGCVGCHDPHHSKNKHLLKRAPTTAACLSCHKELAGEMARASHGHAAIFEGESCLRCHDAHVSKFKNLAKAPVADLCLSCHEKPVRATDGRLLTAFKFWRSKSFRHHGATANPPLDCAACHLVHGSSSRALLKGTYNEKFHAPFDEKSFGLCFRCHKPALATVPNSADATGFRNGAVNLHFLHLNQKGKGRTCRACHNVHAAQNEMLVDEWTSYNGTQLPIQFRKTATGGSCATACHGTKGYDRSNEVKNEKSW